MKNQLIATFVGALIIFIWQFLSWTIVNVHGSEMAYTPNQDAVLESLSANLEEGTYFLPNVAPGTTQEEMEAVMSERMGKPWATISYHNAMEDNMVMNMIRGFVVDLIAIFLLVWLFMKIGGLTMSTAIMGSLAVGFIGYLTVPYLNHIWFETPSLGYLVDTIVQWGLVGAWLGWFLTRK